MITLAEPERITLPELATMDVTRLHGVGDKRAAALAQVDVTSTEGEGSQFTMRLPSAGGTELDAQLIAETAPSHTITIGGD